MKALIAVFFAFFLGGQLNAAEQNSALEKALENYFKVRPGNDSVLVIVYMAARNDLSIYADRHIRQLQYLGSTDKIKMFVHLDIQKDAPGFQSDGQSDKPQSKNFFIDKNRLLKVGPDTLQDSGKKETLIETVKMAYSYFPAQEVIIILWNHGTGPIEPSLPPRSHPWEMWRLPTMGDTVSLDDSLGYIDRITGGESSINEPKGICFDDNSGSFITTNELMHSMKTISQDIIKKKISILACDACTMAHADVFCELSPYVNYFVASQEVELGLGYKYDLLLKPLFTGSYRSLSAFACHFVAAYKEFYAEKIDYYTHCAIDLNAVPLLEQNFAELSAWLMQGLDNEQDKTVKEAIRLSRHKNHCTRFNEPTFLDLGHLYRNLLKNLHTCHLQSPGQTEEFKKHVSSLLTEGINLIKSAVLANAVGEKRRNATGISIYFPETIVHKSYHKNAFANKTQWLHFLKKYVAKH